MLQTHIPSFLLPKGKHPPHTETDICLHKDVQGSGFKVSVRMLVAKHNCSVQENLRAGVRKQSKFRCHFQDHSNCHHINFPSKEGARCSAVAKQLIAGLFCILSSLMLELRFKELVDWNRSLCKRKERRHLCTTSFSNKEGSFCIRNCTVDKSFMRMLKKKNVCLVTLCF